MHCLKIQHNILWCFRPWPARRIRIRWRLFDALLTHSLYLLHIPNRNRSRLENSFDLMPVALHFASAGNFSPFLSGNLIFRHWFGRRSKTGKKIKIVTNTQDTLTQDFQWQTIMFLLIQYNTWPFFVLGCSGFTCCALYSTKFIVRLCGTRSHSHSLLLHLSQSLPIHA